MMQAMNLWYNKTNIGLDVRVPVPAILISSILKSALIGPTNSFIKFKRLEKISGVQDMFIRSEVLWKYLLFSTEMSKRKIKKVEL